jgi:cholesterol transport system auxiliary component
MKRLALFLSALVVVVVAAGCSVLPEPERVQLIDPRPQPQESQREPEPWSLSLSRPETDPARDSVRVLVRTGDGQLQVHPSARWVAPAPELLRTLAIRWLRDSDRLARIDAGIAGTDRVLRLDLRRFELAEPDRGGALAFVIEFDARLTDASSATLPATRLFSHRSRVRGDGPAALVTAAESSLSAVLSDLAAWLSGQPAD